MVQTITISKEIHTIWPVVGTLCEISELTEELLRAQKPKEFQRFRHVERPGGVGKSPATSGTVLGT